VYLPLTSVKGPLAVMVGWSSFTVRGPYGVLCSWSRARTPRAEDDRSHGSENRAHARFRPQAHRYPANQKSEITDQGGSSSEVHFFSVKGPGHGTLGEDEDSRRSKPDVVFVLIKTYPSYFGSSILRGRKHDKQMND